MVVSNNRLYFLYMQGDGQLLLLKYPYGPSYPGEMLWFAGKDNAKYPVTGTPARFVMQTDGNFVGYNASGKAVYATQTTNYPGMYISLQDNGDMIWFSASNQMILHTNTAQ